MPEKTKKNSSRICIIGAGAAGLSAGYFLKEKGYQQVTILEREARIGGKCLSLTYEGKSFDLGANYITSSYTQVKRLARKFGARMYTEGRLRAFNVKTNTNSSLLSAVLAEASVWALAWQSLRFIWKRWRLNRILSPRRPGFQGLAESHPELTRPFGEWLSANGLPAVSALFQIPVTLMGYGQLSEIPAAYALTYMRVGTFTDLMLAALNPHIKGYPKRFTEGYQRLFERISWELDVLTGADVRKVTRTGETIRVEYGVQEELLRPGHPASQTLECDYLIVATPLYLGVLQSFLDLSEEEKALFGQVVYDPFMVTTYAVEGMEDFTAATFMIPEPAIGAPFVVTRQFADNNLVSFYTRTRFGQPVKKEDILAQNAAFARRAAGIDLGDYYTYSEFPYFPHVSSEAMAAGFYDRLEALQGKQNTFFTGGLMQFELVETIVNYSRHLVQRRF